VTSLRPTVGIGALLVALIGAWWLESRCQDADAYTIKSLLTPGCHELITSEALRTVRAELSTAAPLATTANERALVDDVQFTLEKDMRDVGGATLVLGARDNDLKGHSSDDLSFLSEVHVSPLGLEWKLSRLFMLIVNPLSFALPVPKVTGVPLWFPQYRFSIGIGILAG
jgi:hypothetical protein